MPAPKTLTVLSTSLDAGSRRRLRRYFDNRWSELLGDQSFKLPENQSRLEQRFNAMCEELEVVFELKKSAQDDPFEREPSGASERQLNALKKDVGRLGETARGLLGVGLYQQRISGDENAGSPEVFRRADADAAECLRVLELALDGALELASRKPGSGGAIKLPVEDRIYIASMADIYKICFQAEPTTTAESQAEFNFFTFLSLVSDFANPEEDCPYNPHSIGLGLELFRDFLAEK